MYEIISHLAKRHNIYIVSFLTEKETFGLPELQEICKEVITVERRDFNGHSYSLFKPGFLKTFYSEKMKEMIKDILRRIDFDIIHFEYIMMAQYLPSGLKIPALITEHQIGFLYLKRHLSIEDSIYKKMVLYARFLRLYKYEVSTLRRFTKVVLLNKNESDYLRDVFGIDTLISPMGVDFEYFRNDNNIYEDTDLLYIGNFDNYQNVDAIRFFYKEVWPILKKNLPDISLYIVGYNSKKALGHLIDDGNIKLIDYVLDIRPYLKRCKIFILPLRVGSGMRGKILEAMAMEKCVVSTGLGCEGLDEDALKTIIISEHPEEFVKNIGLLLEDKPFRQGLGSMARKSIENRYSWAKVASDIERVYEYFYSKNKV